MEVADLARQLEALTWGPPPPPPPPPVRSPDAANSVDIIAAMGPTQAMPLPPPPPVGIAAAARAMGLGRALGPHAARRKPSTQRIPVSELPLLHEERSLESTFHVTFLLPHGPVGQEFMEHVRVGFAEAEGHLGCGVLVPYADRKTALVSLRQSALRRPQTALDIPQVLLAAADEMSALSTALVYVIHRPLLVDDADVQLGSICAIEASYTAAPGNHPRRFLAELCESDAVTGSCMAPVAAGLANTPRFLSEEILHGLRSHNLGQLPCTHVIRGDPASHSKFLVQVVEALAAHFCQRPPTDDDFSCNAQILSEATTATPSSSISSSPRSSLLQSQPKSPATEAQIEAVCEPIV